MRIGFRHCDPRFGFLWLSEAQPAGRWHSAEEGPANYFADTPTGAWAEFLRHEEITDADDLAGVRRSLWAVELPEEGFERPVVPETIALGGLATYTACQDAARALRAKGVRRLEAPSAALLAGGASGAHTRASGLTNAIPSRDGRVWVLFGEVELRGWLAVDGGSPPASLLQVVRWLD
ncbi:MAG TPA: RES domain-containing protein [Rubrivivax sp.]|nr:RES domain-containing protein [Rubrivivax sp.]